MKGFLYKCCMIVDKALYLFKSTDYLLKYFMFEIITGM